MVDYISLERKKRKENMAEVPQLIDSRDSSLLLKINNHSERFDFDVKKLTDWIKKNPYAWSFFSKDPKKQGMHEKYAADYITNIPKVSEFVKLPASGRNAVYINKDGSLETNLPNRRSMSEASKSLDFYWEYNDVVCYAAHRIKCL